MATGDITIQGNYTFVENALSQQEQYINPAVTTPGESGVVYGVKDGVWTDVYGAGAVSFIQISGEYTALSSDYYIDITANTFTLNLPTAVGVQGKIYEIKNSGTGEVTLDPDGTETIDGETTLILMNLDALTLLSDGTNWIII